MSFFRKIALAFVAAISTLSVAKADIADGQFSTNQIFDVQYYWSGTTLNASSFIAPYDMNFTHPTVSSGQYFQFFNSTTNPGTYGLGLYNSDGTLAQVVHNTGTLQAIGPDALFYIGSGFFGTVITTSAGYSYGDNASFTNMDTSVSGTDTSSYTWASTTPLAAGQTASSSSGSGSGSSGTVWAQANPTVVNIYPTSNNSPPGEDSANAIDGTGTTKYLNFDRTSAGFTVQLSTGRVVSGIQFTTANDFEPRDPSKYTLYGSNDGLNWTKIVDAQAITLSSSRYTETNVIPITNSNAYVFYFITFDSIKAIDTYGSVAGCQAALGNLACDSVQIGEVKYLYDSTSTVTSSFTGSGSIVVQNPGAAPVIVSSAPGSDTITTSTSTGTTVTTTASTNGTPVVVITSSDAAQRQGNDIVVTRTTTTTTTTPVTTVTTNTTPITTTTNTTPNTVNTWSDGSTTTTSGSTTTTTSVTNQVTTSTATTNQVASSVATASESASSKGMQDVIDIAVVNPFVIDPLVMPNGSWVSPRYSSSSTSGTISNKSLSFGHQIAAENSIVGIAGDVGQVDSGSYNNSVTSGTKYSATAYGFTKTDYAWVRGSLGFGINEYSTTMSLPTLGLSNNTKAKQTIVYADVAGYSPKEVYGFRPFVGATFVTSTIDSIKETGNSILSNPPTAGTKAYVNPYVGVRKDIDKGIVVETRVMQTEQYGAVAGSRIVASQKINKDTSVNLTAGYDVGSNYSNGYVMVGLVVNF